MPDIRIKDLTTEASASVTSDFLPIDGNTGTRKLSAFNPSFGGNATVGGTLTVNGGTLTLSGAAYPRLTSNGTSGGAFQIQKNGTNYGLFYGNDTDTIVDSNTSSNIVFQTGGATRATVNSSAFTISLTTASTSTSSGALVVGNGTSGGLGVGGAVNIGGTLTANGTTFNLSTASANGSFINMDGLAGNFKIITTRTGGVDRWYFGQDTAAESGSNAGSPFFIRALTDAGAVIDTPLTITRAAGGRLTTPRPVTISDSTASTSTSSGALVVSGGVGVAGAIYCGSLNATADSKISSAAAKTSSADTLKIATATGGSSDFELLISRSAAGSGAYYSIQSVEQATGYRGLALQKDGGNVLIGTTSDSGQRLQVSGTANITGAISIGNTVNTVSPTAPNRTITMVINGTTYYLHAKTTND
jgi:hypothetical protein